MPTVSDGILDRLERKRVFQDLPNVDRQLTINRTHSYRNWKPEDVVAAAVQLGLSEARDALRFVESGRMFTMLEETSNFFSRLDRDEKEAFTHRNPDLVRWMSAYNISQELNPYGDLVALADGVLIDDGARADPDRVPPFEAKDRGDEDVLQSLRTRRRSYRNFAPHEIEQILTDGNVEARKVFSRIESGRFDPMLKAAHKFFVALDQDEARTFTRRNPGIIDWISAWGASQHLIHGEQLFPFSDFAPPFVPTDDV